MSQQCTPTRVESKSLQQVQLQNEELRRYLTAQKAVITSLERRVGRSLEAMGIHLHSLTETLQQSADWHPHINAVQSEVDCLCDLISDTLLLQKLEAGKIEVHLEPVDLHPLLMAVSRHLLSPRDGTATRLVSEVDPSLPFALADQDLTEAVLTDLLARGMKYSDPTSPVVLGAECVEAQVHVRITAQRFAPLGNRDFATEIVLCCRRIEVQKGSVTCQMHPDGLQTVTITLQMAPKS
jgi:signal transduction histidine kinase